jgi:hypothetical protein
VTLNTHPVAHTRQIDSGLNDVTELSRDFRISFAVLISDEESTPINGRDARNAVSRLQEGGGTVLKPAIKSKISQIHCLQIRIHAVSSFIMRDENVNPMMSGGGGAALAPTARARLRVQRGIPLDGAHLGC